jgi:ribonuclease J
MEIEIATIGGYEEVGRQMTAVRAGDDVVIFDMGLNLSQVLIHDNVETEKMHSLDLIDMGAIPDDRVMSDLEGDVQAIVPTVTSTTSARSRSSPTATTRRSSRRRSPSNW